ncbi:MAG: bifunctional diaminohydroxyphosphoribosylaminopyrimidine deaminase/5-amino-6-(5-phosphoribosylamino)uracil reductase RibD [Candidatus Omnitrophica bacterium]|nr:bifunctional diaminohydroxyphosphoribosylaminopyrimidine deaminase/5-amino-6-(5-phosphoribosylamino)uracil reductase RibD [Candidatus Omnitrophota bacterium]
MNDHLFYMHRAYELAAKGWGRTSPNPMVGAIVVKNGKVMAEGWHARCGADHAEAMALKKAGAKAKGAVLYVTLEPCSHYGRTPPCIDVIIRAGIRKVYVGVLDPNPFMSGKSVKILRKAGISVEVGFLREELTRMNEAFNKWVRTRMPFVVAKTAQTLDGKIATLSGESKWITSKASRDLARRMRFGFDAIAVGVNTVIKDDPVLNSVPAKRLKKIIFDSDLKTPVHARLFKGTRRDDVLILTTSKASARRIRSLGRKAEVMVTPAKESRVDLRRALKILAQREITAILVEGGAALVGVALKEGLVDKMMVYVAPRIMGEGLDAVRGLRVRRLDDTVELKDISVGKIGEDILIEGYL